MRPWMVAAAGTAFFLSAVYPCSSASGAEGGSFPAEYRVGESRINSHNLLEHVESLASPALGGRGAGTVQADSAVAYLLKGFVDSGLLPGLGGESFLLADPAFTGVHAEGQVGMRDQSRGYAYNRDYAPLGVSGEAHDSCSVVFAGYGITAPEYGYDDYLRIRAEGRIVLALMGEPGMGDADGPLLSRLGPPYHQDLFRKAQNAEAHGAKALLLVHGDPLGLDIDRIRRIPSGLGFGAVGIPVCEVTRTVARSLLQTAEADLADLQERIDRTLEPHSLELPDAWVELIVRMHREPGRMITVVGKYPGTGPGAVVVAAAYDGPGPGLDAAKPAFHPAAGDNASGVAALLELAAALPGTPPPDRTIYFVAYAGRHFDAAGLAGFLASGQVDPREIQAVVDIGPLGRGEALYVHGSPASPGLSRWLREAEQGIPGAPRVSLLETRPRTGVLGHLAGQEIPGVLVCGPGDRVFGTPEDKPDDLDYDALERSARYLYAVVRALASDPESHEYVP